MGRLTKLKKLALQYNQLERLPESIRLLSNLRELRLRSNAFSKEEKRKVVQWLPHCDVMFTREED